MWWRLKFFGTLHKTNEPVVVGEHGELSFNIWPKHQFDFFPCKGSEKQKKNVLNKLNVRFKTIYTASSQRVYFKITMELIKWEYVLLK